ncbi:unnamed protein product, partial [Nesidiocoris tenuis]
MKKSCSCRSYEPVLLRNLNLPDELAPKADSESSTSDEKPADLNLLTPKLTKDDEECLDIVKSGFINLVSNKVEGKNYPTVYDFTEDDDDLPITRFEHRSRSLLSIASSESGVRSCSKSFKSAPTSDDELLDRACTCEPNDSSLSVLTVMEVKKRVQCNHYLSVKNFNEEMTQALDYIHADSVKAYRNSLKHVFPWFDPDNPLDTSFSDDPFPLPVEGSPSKISATRMADSGVDAVKKPQCTWNDLLVHDPDYYYVNCKIEDVRLCMFCKEVGEGLPSKEGRLLYCGHNEWVHVNCALWSSEVFEEIDGSLQNVQSAISRSRMIRCCFCDKKGASVGCCARSCPSTYHLSCALQSNCVFLSNKEVYCKNHSHMRGKKDLQNREDFCVSRPVYVELDQKKRKEILHSGVKLAIGSLFIHLLGEIIPECSDLRDVIVPCNFRCARWFWSAEEPWRLVRYFVETKTSSPACEYSVDQDINVTIENSSVGITPPPSPRDPESRSNYNCIADRVEIRNLLNQLVDTVCAREEECNLAEQQGTDLLPPDIEEAIFKDLPHDILDGIDMQDIFPKISFDDFSECKIDKAEVDGETPSNKKSIKEETKPINLKIHKIAKVQKSCKDPGVVNGAQSIDCDTYNWKTSTILQLDGAVDDSSDSEQSVDSCEAQSMNFLRADEPVKCGRCRRTYRSSIGYDRHLPECNSDFSDTDSNEEEQEDVKQNLDVHVGCFKLVKKNENVLDDTMEKNDEDCTESDDGSCNSQTTGRLDVIVDVYEDCMPEPIENGVTLAEVADAVNIPQSSAIIVQEVPHETVMPQYMPAFTSQAAIQQPEIQYFSPPNPNGFQYPGSVPSAVIPSVPSTMLSAIGVDQIMLNSPSPVYQQPPQNNVYIANPSLVVGMETVVSNTVMSSSQFIPGVPGMLASSYSTTTTQVFHAAKPQIDLPPNFVIVNAQPVHQPVVNSAPGLTNLPNYVQDNVSAGTPWNNYQMNVQESHVVSNNCSSYQTVTRKIVHEHKNVDGVKMINSTQETVFIEPIVHTNSIQQQYNCSVKNFNHIPQSIVEKDILTTPSPKPSQPKVVELPRMPTTNREKPQQAVAPVVIKQIVSTPPSSETSPATTVPTIEKTEPEPEQNPPSSKKPNVSLKTEENGLKEVAVLSPNKELLDTGSLASPPPPPSPLKSENESIDMKPSLGLFSEEDKPNHRNGLTIKTLKVEVQRSTIHDTRPKITYEVTSEDGFSCSSSDIHSAWEKIYDRVQNSRKCRGLPPLGKNPFGDTNSVLKKAIGLGNNSVKFIVEQLPGASSCTNYRPVYHKKKLSALEQELSRNRPNENYRGCARADIYPHKQHTYDMFSWLASRHRRPPKLTNFDVDIINSNRLFHLPFQPNCYSKVVDIFGKKRIVIFALRKIIQGEELTYDYKFPLEEDKIKNGTNAPCWHSSRIKLIPIVNGSIVIILKSRIGTELQKKLFLIHIYSESLPEQVSVCPRTLRPGAHLRQNDAGRRVIFNRITRNTQRSIVRCTRDADTYLQLASLRIGIEVDAGTCGTRVGADSYPAARYPYQYSRGNRPVHTCSCVKSASTSLSEIFREFQPTRQIDDCSCSVDTVDHFNNAKVFPRLISLLEKDYFRFYKDDIPLGLKGHDLHDENMAVKCNIFFQYLKASPDSDDENECIEDDLDPELGFLNTTIRVNGSIVIVLKSRIGTEIQKKLFLVHIYSESLPEQVPKESYSDYIRSSMLNDLCLEKRVFYRVISGLHTSINIHLCSNYLFSESLPEQVSACDASFSIDFSMLNRMRPSPRRSFPDHFDESSMFSGGQQALKLKEEFRQHFKNITRIMDCVGCEKCKLWGKLQDAEIRYTASEEPLSKIGWAKIRPDQLRILALPILLRSYSEGPYPHNFQWS